MFEDYLSWKKQNEEFIEELKKHQSILYGRIYDVSRVLDFISNMSEKELNEYREDLSLIFETGYAYIYSFVNDIKLYLENYFHNNMNTLIKYDDLINYSLYLCEVKDSLIDDNDYDEIKGEQFEYILNDIEERVQNRKEYNKDVLEDYNNRLLSIMPMNKVYKCVDEIFVDVYDALKMD